VSHDTPQPQTQKAATRPVQALVGNNDHLTHNNNNNNNNNINNWRPSETLLGINNGNRRYMLYVCMYVCTYIYIVKKKTFKNVK